MGGILYADPQRNCGQRDLDYIDLYRAKIIERDTCRVGYNGSGSYVTPASLRIAEVDFHHFVSRCEKKNRQCNASMVGRNY